MIKTTAILTAMGLAILGMPWTPPFTYNQYLIIFVGYILLLGPGFLLVIAVLNRLINISFTTDYKKKD